MSTTLTLTIDDDLAELLQRRARESDMSFREVVNAALRRSLAEAESTGDKPAITVRPHDFGSIRPGIDPDRFNQLLDDLEGGEFLRKSHNPG
ncbi:MAG: ribbon-helix-helix protein, CopG family [Verrucomicrobiaceae bacterium]|nr:MAG: ribbon-helix-helix protein, CopG family [Verrucomicrobiaceae bacterium]